MKSIKSWICYSGGGGGGGSSLYLLTACLYRSIVMGDGEVGAGSWISSCVGSKEAQKQMASCCAFSCLRRAFSNLRLATSNSRASSLATRPSPSSTTSVVLFLAFLRRAGLVRIEDDGKPKGPRRGSSCRPRIPSFRPRARHAAKKQQVETKGLKQQVERTD
jgi:hypothetical protein